jgi:hypothetical protein
MTVDKTKTIKKITSPSMFEAAQEIEYNGVFTFDGKIGCFFQGEAVYYTTTEIAFEALASFMEENS